MTCYECAAKESLFYTASSLVIADPFTCHPIGYKYPQHVSFNRVLIGSFGLVYDIALDFYFGENTDMTDIKKTQKMANAIRALSMDAVQAANSGHPGMPMGMADVATVLFTQFLKFDPRAPKWPDRDRFVLSAGHGSMLLYSLLTSPAMKI